MLRADPMKGSGGISRGSDDEGRVEVFAKAPGNGVRLALLEGAAFHRRANFGPVTAKGNMEFCQTESLCEACALVRNRRGGAGKNPSDW